MRNYLATPTVVTTRNETFRLRSLDQLNGRSVALVKRYSSSEKAMELYPGMVVMGVSSPLEGLLAVSDGRAEAYIGVWGINTYLASRNGITNLK
jgi:two-component system sensor histidine kinase EvgS